MKDILEDAMIAFGYLFGITAIIVVFAMFVVVVANAVFG